MPEGKDIPFSLEGEAGSTSERIANLIERQTELLEEQIKLLKERKEKEETGEVFGALFGAGDRVTTITLGQFLPREFLKERGFVVVEKGKERGADYREPAEFGEGVRGYENWLTGIFGNLWEYQLFLDEGVRTFVKGEIIRAEGLSLLQIQKKHLLSLADGLFFIHNYNLAWLGSNGEMSRFAVSPREGGIVSENERDRLSFEHLKLQCRLFPGMARALSFTDQWAAGQRYMPEFPGWIEVSPEDYCEGLSAHKLGLTEEREWLVNYQKQLAMAWYRIAGFLDARNYAEKHRRYTEFLPSRESELETRGGKERYQRAVNFRRWSNNYDSPYTFLMDPLSLLADIQAKYQEIVDNIRVGIREYNIGHNIFNLGWRPAAWLLLEKIAGHPLTSEELEAVNLAEIGGERKTLAELSDKEWKELLRGLDLQKTNIKNGAKAATAVDAFYNCFNLDPGEFVKLYAAIVSYLRTDDPRKDGIWTKSKILPLVTRAIGEIIESVRREGKTKLPVSKTEMRKILWGIESMVAPATPFTEEQKGFLLDSATDTATVRAIGA